MEAVLLMLVVLLGGFWKTEAISKTGSEGGEITIECSHANAFSNVKYFCTENCRNEDILISTQNKKEYSNGKYSISDKGNTFYVTISRLTVDDSGTYWCGIERVGVDTYTEVFLTVKPGSTEGNGKDSNDAPSPMKLVYIGAGLAVVVLALAIVLLIFFRHRSRDNSKSSGKVHDTVYATPQKQKRDACHVTASSSPANEEQGAGGGKDSVHSSSSIWPIETSTDEPDDIYSNVAVSSDSQVEPDGLVYSSVSFKKNTDCSAVTHPTVQVTYSTIEQL